MNSVGVAQQKQPVVAGCVKVENAFDAGNGQIKQNAVPGGINYLIGPGVVTQQLADVLPKSSIVNHARFVVVPEVVLFPEVGNGFFGQVSKRGEVADGRTHVNWDNHIAEVENNVAEVGLGSWSNHAGAGW